MKHYYEYMNEISEDELFDGLLGYGMFSEKLPPVFSSEEFCKYYKSLSVIPPESATGYVYFESMRNTNIPRALGIPTPFNYAKLCQELKDNWESIKQVFKNNTINDEHKVSRIHIRKRPDSSSLLELGYEEEYGPDDEEADNIDFDQITDTPESQDCSGEMCNSKSLFSMSYKNWREDGDPIMEFSLGMKYMVKTDISQCFPSAYSHAIAWALVGKETAKRHKYDDIWYNNIDKACRNIKGGETNGFIIGPHTSNVLSEIILTVIDKELIKKKYQFIRNIDDYTCYTETYEKAEQFLVDLHLVLKEYGFALNYKKTFIQELPQATAGEWIQILKDKYALNKDRIEYSIARAYIDTAILAMKNNGNNASSLFFAIKVLGNETNSISDEAKKYCVRKMCDLAIIYPYLVPNMDRYVFEAFSASVKDIKAFSIKLYEDSVSGSNFEGISYALYYAMKYDFEVLDDGDYILNSSDCLSKLMLWLYSKKRNLLDIKNKLEAHAKILLTNDAFDENWIFVYEVLLETELSDEWKSMKHEGISFIKTSTKNERKKIAGKMQQTSFNHFSNMVAQELPFNIENEKNGAN